MKETFVQDPQKSQALEKSTRMSFRSSYQKQSLATEPAYSKPSRSAYVPYNTHITAYPLVRGTLQKIRVYRDAAAKPCRAIALGPLRRHGGEMGVFG